MEVFIIPDSLRGFWCRPPRDEPRDDDVISFRTFDDLIDGLGMTFDQKSERSEQLEDDRVIGRRRHVEAIEEAQARKQNAWKKKKKHF